jgi:hypothetical protein
VNFLAHGRRFVASPYRLAGTALPDWLRFADRRVRLRRQQVEPYTRSADARLAELAEGVLAHLADDAWLHQSAVFAQLSWSVSALIRRALPDDQGLRPHFLGHVLVELLLDAALAAEEPGLLAAYYGAVAAVDPELVARGAERMAPPGAAGLPAAIERFLQSRFLSDYAEDGKLLGRLNQVLVRVGLCPLPERLDAVLAEARVLVFARRQELLPAAARAA